MTTQRGRIRPLLLVLGLFCGVAAAALVRRSIDVVEVAGRSMAPTLLPGELLLVERATLAWRSPRTGELVVAADPRRPSRELVKRVAAVEDGFATLRGDNATATTDSLTFGALPVSAIRWRVVGRYWPPRRIGLV